MIAGGQNLGQFLVNDFHDLLAGRQALQNRAVQRTFLHVGDKIAGDAEIDVGFKERTAHLA